MQTVKGDETENKHFACKAEQTNFKVATKLMLCKQDHQLVAMNTEIKRSWHNSDEKTIIKYVFQHILLRRMSLAPAEHVLD